MKAIACASMLLLACGGATREVARPKEPPVRPNPHEKLLEQQKQRIAELEARLALVEAEAREIRGTLADRQRRQSTRTIRIGAKRADVAAEQTREAPALDEDDGKPRPLLRLYGRPNKPASEDRPLVLPEAPDGVPTRLPVAPLPSEGGAEEQAPAAKADAVTEYRQALSLIRDGDFQGALDALTRFLADHAGSSYADAATYWRAEMYYAGHHYERALAEFQRVVSGFAGSERVPDALLKIAMCHRRLGDRAQARQVFQRVQKEFPGTRAARIAAREDAS